MSLNHPIAIQNVLVYVPVHVPYMINVHNKHIPVEQYVSELLIEKYIRSNKLTTPKFLQNNNIGVPSSISSEMVPSSFSMIEPALCIISCITSVPSHCLDCANHCCRCGSYNQYKPVHLYKFSNICQECINLDVRHIRECITSVYECTIERLNWYMDQLNSSRMQYVEWCIGMCTIARKCIGV